MKKRCSKCTFFFLSPPKSYLKKLQKYNLINKLEYYIHKILKEKIIEYLYLYTKGEFYGALLGHPHGMQCINKFFYILKRRRLSGGILII